MRFSLTIAIHEEAPSRWADWGKMEDYFWTNCRLAPRMNFSALEISEINYLERLHGEMLTTMSPEEICAELRDFFKQGR